jgi:hypothetical protein
MSVTECVPDELMIRGVVVEIPARPGCEGRNWECVEELAGSSKEYELRADRWTLVDSSTELLETNYRCRDCDYDPGELEEDW